MGELLEPLRSNKSDDEIDQKNEGDAAAEDVVDGHGDTSEHFAGGAVGDGDNEERHAAHHQNRIEHSNSPMPPLKYFTEGGRAYRPRSDEKIIPKGSDATAVVH